MTNKVAMILLLIPLALLILGVILFITGCVLEGPTSRGTAYSIVMIAAIGCFILALFPGVILAIIGTIQAAKAHMTFFLVLGIVEILAAVAILGLLLFIIFVAGRGV